MVGGPHGPARRCPECHRGLDMDADRCTCGWAEWQADEKLADMLPDGMTLEDLPAPGEPRDRQCKYPGCDDPAAEGSRFCCPAHAIQYDNHRPSPHEVDR